MTTIESDLKPLSADESAFVDATVRNAERVFRVFRETGTTTGYGTVNIAERIPGTDAHVSVSDPGPWAEDATLRPVVFNNDGTVRQGPAGARGGFGFGKILAAHENITTVVHVHAPHLGAWSQTHRPLPLHYVPVQRFTLASEIATYTDRRQSQVDFILDRLNESPHHFAILEANGGATVWGDRGLLATAELITLLEEGAKYQILAEAIGGSQPYGPGVRRQAWSFHGLLAQAEAEGLLPADG
jgi:ribulose-5-phosphate 4-epimerase/fuculose-1-phosphate aldolase